MALTDVEIVAILAVALIITYFIGTYWKHTILKRYAHWFEDKFSRTAKVRYKSFGHAGLRIKCEMNNPSDGYKELEFALSLGARENLVYYPYKLVARDSDKLNCWAALTDPVKFQVEITRQRKKVKVTWDTAGIEEVKNPQLEELGYRVYSTGPEFANRLVERSGVIARLKELSNVESLELQEEPSRIHLVARLDMDDLAKVIDLISLVGRSI